MSSSTRQLPGMGSLVQTTKVGPPSPHLLQSQSPHACLSPARSWFFYLKYVELFRSVFPASWFPALQANQYQPALALAKAASKPCSLPSRPLAPPTFLCSQLWASLSHFQLPSLVNQVSSCASVRFSLSWRVTKPPTSWFSQRRTSQGYSKSKEQGMKRCNSKEFWEGCKWSVIIQG